MTALGAIACRLLAWAARWFGGPDGELHADEKEEA